MPRCFRAVRLFVVCAWSVAAAALAGTLPPPGADGRVTCPYCDLRGASLAGRDLRYANFAGADLAGANLTGANLGGAALVAANLTGADLRNAVFTAASDLTAANLTNARLNGATLGAAVFEFADLSGADLSGTDSSAAIFGPKRGTTASARYYCGAKDTTGLPNVRYVASSGSDSATCGASLQSPCATVQRGITNCTGEQCAVLVAYDEYKLSGTLLLTGAVSVYGGCAMLDDPQPELRSILRGPDGAPAVMASRIVAPTVFQGFSVFAAAGRATAGGTAIAFVSILSSGVSLESVSLTAGVGGRPPDAGDGRRPPKADNGREQSGGRSPANAGGGGGGSFSRGGNPGEPGDTGFRAPNGNGGLIRGSSGDAGRDGPCRGPGTSTPDLLGAINSSSSFWMPSVGGSGQKGGFGGGGGGGGGAAARVGGGGGAGGEGGGGGEGGTQGGASIGLLIVGGRLTYTGGAVRGGAGGNGGRGGNGAPRGLPGNGDKDRGVGGDGGDGGLGGPGAGGAGGNGGPAFAVATAGTSDDDGTFIGKSVELYVGKGGDVPGQGGAGSSPCPNGNEGLRGITAPNQRLEIKK